MVIVITGTGLSGMREDLGLGTDSTEGQVLDQGRKTDLTDTTEDLGQETELEATDITESLVPVQEIEQRGTTKNLDLVLEIEPINTAGNLILDLILEIEWTNIVKIDLVPEIEQTKVTGNLDLILEIEQSDLLRTGHNRKTLQAKVKYEIGIQKSIRKVRELKAVRIKYLQNKK